MAHVRAALLAAAKAALDANTALPAVYAQRVPPTRQIWPAVCVYAEAEDVEQLGMTYPRQQLRTLQMQVKGWLRPTQDDEANETALDQLAVEIEDTLKASSLAGDKDLALVSTTWADELVGELAMMSVTLTYQARYTTTEYLPETAT